MKTVNFLEALEANKTKRIAFYYDKVNVIDSWYEVGELERDLKNESKILLHSELVGPWVIELERIEFECSWRVHDYNICPGIPSNDYDLNYLVGKRTKVILEVIE